MEKKIFILKTRIFSYINYFPTIPTTTKNLIQVEKEKLKLSQFAYDMI